MRLLSISITNVRFNSVFPKDDLPRIKDGEYVKNLADKQKELIGFHYLLTEIQLFLLNFFFFCIKYVCQEVLKKSKIIITHNVFSIQCDDSIICGFY